MVLNFTCEPSQQLLSSSTHGRGGESGGERERDKEGEGDVLREHERETNQKKWNTIRKGSTQRGRRRHGK